MSPVLSAFAATGARLEDVVGRDDVSAVKFIARLSKLYLIFVAAFFGVPFFLLALAGKAPFWGLFFVLGFFGGVGLILMTLQSLLGILILRSSLPRTAYVEGGEFGVETSQKSWQCDLTECTWHEGSTSHDQLCMFSGLRRGIVVQTPRAQIAIGHSAGARELWRAFLTLTRLPENKPAGPWRVVWIVTLAILVGLLIGGCLGHFASLLTGQNIWRVSLSILGLVDGLAIGASLTTCTGDHVAAARQRFHPAILALLYFLVALKVSLVAGWLPALVCAASNASLGLLVGLWCRAKIAAAERERDVARQFRSPIMQP